MFLSDTHLPQALTRAQYREQAYLDREIEDAFLPAWHMIASVQDFPKDGDFLKMPLFGREVILWRCGTEYHCFLNVCPHRFCALTNQDKGRSPERLRCQYHGWEFDGTGNTRKIPDAPSFKPLSKGSVGLKRFPVEKVGQLLFINLHEDPKPIREFLGPAYDLINDRFNDEWKQVWAYAPVSDGNWKEAVEITLEGYHVVATHEKTLGKYPMVTEDRVTHEYPDDLHTIFKADHNDDTHPIYGVQRLIAKVCGWESNLTWHHYHAFPHVGIVSSSAHALAQCVIPISPHQHINLHRVFTRKSARRNIGSRIVAKFNSNSLFKLSRDTLAEDQATIAAHHRGLSMPVLPQGGLVSRREERIFHFQKYINRLHEGVELNGNGNGHSSGNGHSNGNGQSSFATAMTAAAGEGCSTSGCGACGDA